MRVIKTDLFFVLALFFLLVNTGQACTDFKIIAKDNSVVIARTMEFPTDLGSRIWVVPRGIKTTSTNDKKLHGLSWTNKYAFLALDAYNMDSTFIDGMNEAGLSVGGLMFTGAKYQTTNSTDFVTIADFVSWLLGNFSTTEEVKKNLSKTKIIDTYIKQFRGSLGLHFSIHDVKGSSLAVEFIDGEIKVHDNPVGVMTNRPDFKWHLQNLSNYINIDHLDRKPKKINGFNVEPTGVGSGFLGLPGDWTPPSRFVRVALLLDASVQPKNSAEAINLSEHIMNSIDMPIGAIKEKPLKVVTVYGHAQWSIIKDLKNNTMYFRTYDNMTLRKINMNDFDLQNGAPKKYIPVSKEIKKFEDISDKLIL